MPEMRFRVRWPDQTSTECLSPSRAIGGFLTAGASYPLGEFLARSRAGLHAASERVRAVHGHPCSQAAAQLDAIERIAARFAPTDSVTVERLTPA